MMLIDNCTNVIFIQTQNSHRSVFYHKLGKLFLIDSQFLFVQFISLFEWLLVCLNFAIIAANAECLHDVGV